MRELRDITEAVRGVFELDGYGEVWTPALEYEAVLGRGGGAPPAYRVFDDHGEVLALRTDMTVPIARLVAHALPDRRAAAALLLLRPRLPRRAPAPRADARVPAGRDRARRRAGARQGTAEALTVLCHALDARRAARLPHRARRRVAVPDAAALAGRPRGGRASGSWTRSSRATSSRWSASSGGSGSTTPTPSCCCACRRCAAGRTCSTSAEGPVADAVAGLRSVLRAARARGRRARDLRPRPGRATWATTPARCSRSTTRRSARRSAAAGATTTCSAASAARCPRSASR